MKKYNLLLLFFIILSACGVRGMFNTVPVHVYDLNSYRGETGSIYAQVPMKVVKIDGLSIYEISKKFKRKKDPYGMKQSTIFLIPGEHTLTVQGGSVSTSALTITLRGSWNFKVMIKAGRKYKIDYKNQGKGVASVFIKDLATRKKVGTLIKNNYKVIPVKSGKQTLYLRVKPKEDKEVIEKKETNKKALENSVRWEDLKSGMVIQLWYQWYEGDRNCIIKSLKKVEGEMVINIKSLDNKKEKELKLRNTKDITILAETLEEFNKK